MQEDDRWYSDWEQRQERDLEAEDAERERELERYYEKGEALAAVKEKGEEDDGNS